MVTRFPNHWWASSCPTTRATHWRDEEQEFLGSMSNAVSLCRRERQNSAGWDQSPRGIKITTQRRWNYLSKLKSEEKKHPQKKPPQKKPNPVCEIQRSWNSRGEFRSCWKALEQEFLPGMQEVPKKPPPKTSGRRRKIYPFIYENAPLRQFWEPQLPSRLPQHSRRNSASSKRC